MIARFVLMPCHFWTKTPGQVDWWIVVVESLGAKLFIWWEECNNVIFSYLNIPVNKNTREYLVFASNEFILKRN